MINCPCCNLAIKAYPSSRLPLADRIKMQCSFQPAPSEADVEGPCWIWTGAMSNPKGAPYGVMYADGALQRVHRVSYELWVGPIPEGLHVHHVCERTTCVSPLHVTPMLPRDNILLSSNPSAINARKTHCIHDHEFTVENTILRAGGSARSCRECGRWAQKEFQLRKKAGSA